VVKLRCVLGKSAEMYWAECLELGLRAEASNAKQFSGDLLASIIHQSGVPKRAFWEVYFDLESAREIQ